MWHGEDVVPTMDAKSVEVIVSCEGEFYSVPPEDHIARYKWAISRLLESTRFDCSVFDLGLVVDVGCGSGYGTDLMADAGFNAVGFERNPMALEFCRSREVQAYGIEYPCLLFKPAAPWMAVVLMEVIEHSENGMAILAQAMKDAEIVLASVPYNEAPGSNAFHKLHGLTEESFKWMSPSPTFHRIPEAPDSLLIHWKRAA